MSKNKNKQKKDKKQKTVDDDLFNPVMPFDLIQVYLNKSALDQYKLIYSYLIADDDTWDSDTDFVQQEVAEVINRTISKSRYKITAWNSNNSSKFKSEYDCNKTLFNTFMTEPNSGIISRGQDSDTIFLQNKDNSDDNIRVDIINDYFALPRKNCYTIDERGKIKQESYLTCVTDSYSSDVFAFDYRKHECCFYTSKIKLLERDLKAGFLLPDFKSDKEVGAKLFCNEIAPITDNNVRNDFYIAKARYKAPDNTDSIARGVVNVPRINRRMKDFQPEFMSELNVTAEQMRGNSLFDDWKVNWS